jgi:hypothetical protein
MRLYHVFAGVFLLLAAAAASAPAAEEAKTTPEDSVKAAIQDGIKLLEAKDYAAFLKKFVKPSDMESILKHEKSFDQFVKMFGRDKADDILKVLNQIKDTKPTFNKENTQAVFPVKDIPGVSQKEITFTKVEDRWCIENH